MKNFQIPKVFFWKKEDHQDEFNELFRLRHDTVHTVMPLKEDITKYHKITEDMMMHVLDKTYNGDEYFYASKGNAFFTLERYDDATQCYDYLISIRPDHRKHMPNKGFSLAALGRYAEMLGCFEKAIGLIPNLALAYVGKGLALAELGRYDEALGVPLSRHQHWEMMMLLDSTTKGLHLQNLDGTMRHWGALKRQ